VWLNYVKVFIAKKWKIALKLIFAAFILFLIVKGGSDQIQKIDLSKTIDLLRKLPFTNAISLIILGLAATATMTLYDFSIIRYFKHSIKTSLFLVLRL